MIAIVVTADQTRVGVEWESLGLLVLMNGLLEGVVLVYVLSSNPVVALIERSSSAVGG